MKRRKITFNSSIKTGVFSLVGNYLRPSNNYRQSSFNINAVVLILIICKDLQNWYNVYLNFSLKNRNIISKIKRSKVTDYAPLSGHSKRDKTKVLKTYGS